MDLPLLLAAAFIFGPLISGLIALLGAVDIRELRREISWPRAIWNRSQTSISVMCASVVFSELSHLGDWPLTPLVALAALGVDVAVNYTIVAYGTSLRRGAPLRDSLRAMRFGSPSSFLMSYLCFGFIGILIAEAYTRFGLSGVVASVAPVILGKQLFVHRSRLEDVELTLADSTTALGHVDERIAAERQLERSRIAAALHDERKAVARPARADHALDVGDARCRDTADGENKVVTFEADARKVAHVQRKQKAV